jgi:hypothetical protein
MLAGGLLTTVYAVDILLSFLIKLLDAPEVEII